MCCKFFFQDFKMILISNLLKEKVTDVTHSKYAFSINEFFSLKCFSNISFTVETQKLLPLLTMYPQISIELPF